MTAVAVARTPLAKRLILERVSRDWTQVDVAERAGLSPSTVALAETGRAKVRARTIYKLAQALELDPAELLKLSEIEAQDDSG